jgi:hypothetical protein
MSEPTLDAVLAVARGMVRVELCLEALQRQRTAIRTLIVVSNYQPPPELQERFAWATWRIAPAATLIPELWGQGIREARADIVALTTAQFLPAPDWASSIRRAHTRLAAVGIGGAIDPPRGRGAIAWAEYFLRYHALFLLDREQRVADFPGDNGTYKRQAIANLTAGGFWEHEIHRELRRQSQSLIWTPQIRVTHQGGLGFAAFLRQRFAHGWRFGCTRTKQNGELWRRVMLLASPLLPLVFLSKIVRCVARRVEHTLPFCLTFPVLLCFLLAWCLGETWAYAFAERATAASPLLATGGRL